MSDGAVRAHTLPTVSEALIARVGDDRPALLFEDEVVSWASLLEQASARARLALDLRRDGPFHIAVLLENVPEYVYWIAAAALAGATVVGVNATRRGSELAGDITHTDCQLMVTDSGQARLLDGLDTGVEADRVLLADDPSYLGRVDLRRSLGVPAVEVGPGDLFLLLFTSGSTGAPKAVVCTQGRFARISSTTPACSGSRRER